MSASRPVWNRPFRNHIIVPMVSAAPEILTDPLTLRLYANDASMYEELPKGVCFPGSTEQLCELVRYAKKNKLSITARAAGTSLAGQATGDGIIADTSRFMDRILTLNPDERRAVVQPGVIRDALNREAAKYGLLFGPDTSTTNRCMLGGMIGNNSAGSYSIKYGSTREHIISVKAVLSDGSTAVFGPLSGDELQAKQNLSTLEGEIYRRIIPLLKKQKKAIVESYPHPEVKRRNTGYALDKLCEMEPVTPGGRPFNLAELLCGSEGTLALTASAEVRLVHADPVKTLIIPHFHNLDDAMRATVEAVKFNPAAVELIDDHVLNATKGNLEQQRNRFFLDGEPRCLLIIEFDGQSREEVDKKSNQLIEYFASAGLGYALPVISEPEKMKRVWDLRKAGLGLLMGLADDAQTPSFAEDTAVRVQDLPDYIQNFQKLLAKYNTTCVFYAHASVGELHLRPVFDLKKQTDVDGMKAMMEDVADLVKSYRGSLSGEHGDGRNRSPYIEKVIGRDMAALLREVKEIWDPDYVFNPGKIVKPLPMDSHLRYKPGGGIQELSTVFKWRKEGGFNNALELCNGAGVCRKRHESGGTMCPSYMATLDEKDSTRGRANVLRQLFTSAGPEAFASSEIHEALKLCLSCKACKSECPANVDMARFKSEFLQGWYDRNGTGFESGFWSNPFPFLKLGAAFPAVSNAVARSNPGRFLMQKFIGLHPERPLPGFAVEPFHKWIKGRELNKGRNRSKVLLLVDPFTDLHQPSQAIAAWKLLEKAGLELLPPLIESTGRTLISGGQPRKARMHISSLVKKLKTLAKRGVYIVGLEPSELLTLRDEYLDLCNSEELDDVRRISTQAFLVEELLAEMVSPEMFKKLPEGNNETVYVHGHCYVKALTGTAALEKTLHMAGYNPVMLDAGCCGMAGSFGYRNDTYELSQKIGEQRLFKMLSELPSDALICVQGFSCRHQILDGTGRRILHPAELLEGSFKYRAKQAIK